MKKFKNNLKSVIPIAFLLTLTVFNSNAQSATEAERFYNQKQYKSGIEYIVKNQDFFKHDAFVNYLLGEMGIKSENWAAAQTGYENVLKLTHPPKPNRNIHEEINTSLYTKSNEIYWCAWDGLGVVYYMMGNYKKSLQSLEEANKWVNMVSIVISDKSKHYYNLACAYSIDKQFAKAVSSLNEAIKIEPDYKGKASYERDFDSMANYQPFIKLLATN